MGVYIPTEDVQEARRVSLLDFLRQNRPAMYSSIEQVGSQYVVKARYFGTSGEYSSFMIRASDGAWWHHSKGTHGRNALDYLMREEGMDFQSAIFEILGTSEDYYRELKRHEGGDSYQAVRFKRKYDTGDTQSQKSQSVSRMRKELEIPERDTDTSALYAYLTGRGISEEVIDYFVEQGSLYQGRKYKNVCFVGYDRDGKPRLINQRATKGKFKGNSAGSDRRYSFMNVAEGRWDVHVFEGPIDMLSFACMINLAGYDFRQFNLISLSGISGTGSDANAKLPIGLEEYLERFPDTLRVWIYFDNDDAGRKAGLRLKEVLNKMGIRAMLIHPADGNKDVNESLFDLNRKVCKREPNLIFSSEMVKYLYGSCPRNKICDINSEIERIENDETVATVMNTVAEYYGVDVNDLRKRSCEKKACLARRVSIFLVNYFVPMTMLELGNLHGGLDYHILTHILERIEEERKNSSFEKELFELIKRIQR